MLNNIQKKQINDFNGAKELAFSLPNNSYQRYNDSNYLGAHIQNRYFVIGETEQDIQNAKFRDAENRPMREVNQGFTLMQGN